MPEKGYIPIITTPESFDKWLPKARRDLDLFLSRSRSLTALPESVDQVRSRIRPQELVVELFRAKTPVDSTRHLQEAVRFSLENPGRLTLPEDASHSVTEHAKAVVRAVEPVVNRLEHWYSFGSQRLLPEFPGLFDKASLNLFMQEFPRLRDRLNGLKAGLGLAIAGVVIVSAAVLANRSTAGQPSLGTGTTQPRAETAPNMAEWHSGGKPRLVASQGDQRLPTGVTV